MGMRKRTPQLEDTIVDGLAVGIPLRQLCRENDIHFSAVYDWMEADEDFSRRIARARERGYHAIADSTIEIADDQDEDPASRRVRIDTRLKLLAKWDPKRYGDKVLHGQDPDSGPVQVLITRFDAPDRPTS